MCELKGILNEGELYIQRGVQKRYYDGDMVCEYVFQFPLNVSFRNGYCIDSRCVDLLFEVGYDEFGNFMLYGRNRYGLIDVLMYLDNVSLEEFNNRFIKLSNFISNATFIGREFKRKSPVITYYGEKDKIGKIMDCSYMDYEYANNRYIVLYMKDNTCLVKYKCLYGNGYCIIDCRYFQDSMYYFGKHVYNEYCDYEKVYFDILKYISDLKKNDGNNKNRIRKI